MKSGSRCVLLLFFFLNHEVHLLQVKTVIWEARQVCPHSFYGRAFFWNVHFSYYFPTNIWPFPTGLLFFVVYFGLLLLLLSPVTPIEVVTYMQASNMPAIIISKVGEDETAAVQDNFLGLCAYFRKSSFFQHGWKYPQNSKTFSSKFDAVDNWVVVFFPADPGHGKLP